MSYQDTLRGRMENKASEGAGILLLLVGIGLLSNLTVNTVVAGVLVLYAGALLFPATRSFASRGRFRGRPRKRYREALLYVIVFIVLYLAALAHFW